MPLRPPLKKPQYAKKKPSRVSPKKPLYTTGAGHTVEGRKDLYTKLASPAERAGRGGGDAKVAAGFTGFGFAGLVSGRLKYNAAQKDTKRLYGAEDAARARIKPIIDPDADVANRRRKAAKRKTKGRMGTILSQGQGTQNLGAKGTLG